jgi:hypothetical protein
MRINSSLAMAIVSAAAIALGSACGGAPSVPNVATSAPLTPSSAPTAVATATPELSPSAAATAATATPLAPSTPAPTPTPVITAAPTPTAVPTPAPTPTPEPVATPTAAPVATPTTAPLATATPSVPPTTAPSGAPTASPTLGAGEATLDAAASVPANSEFPVRWTGPNADKDYITIVALGAPAWSGEDYFYTALANPGTLLTPTTTGDYELWYVRGADEAILARRAVTVAPFVGSVSGPPEVEAGSRFQVAWTGPDAPGDYVTIVPLGAASWTDESYFRTSDQINPGTLVASLKAGDYEIWYAAGADAKPMARAPIHVRPYVIKLDAPASVKAGKTFLVKWKGPDGPADYITIVPAGAEAGFYLSYAYTSSGTPATLTAPTKPGDYEIRYQSDREPKIVFGSITIKVRK